MNKASYIYHKKKKKEKRNILMTFALRLLIAGCEIVLYNTLLIVI